MKLISGHHFLKTQGVHWQGLQTLIVSKSYTCQVSHNILIINMDDEIRCYIPYAVGNKAKGRILKRDKITKGAKFSKKRTFLTPDTHTYMCVSGGKKCLFFKKFGGACFLVTPVLSKLINYHSPWKHQETISFLMISGGIKVN